MMKIAVAVATADALPNAFVVWRGVEESIIKAAEYGYDGIELALQTADQINVDTVRKLLAEHNLCCPVISTGQVFAGLGLYFTVRDEEKRRQVISIFTDLIELASAFGAMVNIGRVRGFIEDGESYQDATARFVEVARELTLYAQSKGVTLILEPVNRYELNFINSIEQGVKLLHAVGAPNLALMPDLFHMNIEDRTLAGELERYRQHIAYLHFADSNRLSPGQGHTDFPAVFAALHRMRYDGWISVEILPFPDADTAARQAINYLAPFQEEFNRA